MSRTIIFYCDRCGNLIPELPFEIRFELSHPQCASDYQFCSSCLIALQTWAKAGVALPEGLAFLTKLMPPVEPKKEDRFGPLSEPLDEQCRNVSKHHAGNPRCDLSRQHTTSEHTAVHEGQRIYWSANDGEWWVFT